MQQQTSTARTRSAPVDSSRGRDRGHPAAAQLVPARVAAWARSQPERPAVVQADRVLTYGELLRRAGALAARLRRHSVGPDVLVPLWMDRSPELVVAALAVWLAGGAYVGLDVNEP